MVTAAECIEQGRLARKERNFTAARARYAEAAKIYRSQDDALAYAHTIRHIADIFMQESNLAEAKPLYEEALEICRTNLGTKILDLANTIRPYALLNELQGSKAAARTLWEEARNLYGSLRMKPGVSECEAHIGQLASSTAS